MPDISIVLNVHRERSYYKRTTASIEASVRHANLIGLKCELIVVADRPDNATKEWFEKYHHPCYTNINIIEVDNGSLGLSRNDGICIATGEYILTADADDLISINTITASLAAAEAYDAPALFFPEYYYAFGFNPHLYRMHPVSETSPYAIVGSHPFVSRFFARKVDIQNLLFSDLRVSTGFAYEDWHYNLKALASGLDLRIVKDATVYYLQRSGSLMRQASNISLGLTAHCDFFKPNYYLNIVQKYQEVFPAEDLINSNEILNKFCNNQLQMEMLLLASRIDPSIDPLQTSHLKAFSNLGNDRRPGYYWKKICEKLNDNYYDEVVLMPFISRGGGEKYVLNVIRELSKQNSDIRTLIVSGEAYESHYGIENLPDKVDFIDLYSICNGATADRIDEMALRIIQTFADKARIHLKVCSFSLRILEKFGAILDNKFIYYRFCDTHNLYEGQWTRSGWECKSIVSNGHLVHTFICDNRSILEFDINRFDHLIDKYHVLYTPVESGPSKKAGGAGARRILWASRLDSQKRPDILAEIAIRLIKSHPDIKIDVWGESVIGGENINKLYSLPNIEMKGPFEGFNSIPLENYGIFLYTSAYDGLPIVILDALQAGLAVIAPNVGGIAEVLDIHTGWLLPSHTNDGELIDSYVASLHACLSDQEEWHDRIEKSQSKLITQHSQESFAARVAQLF